MRRNESTGMNPSEIERMAAACEVGFLGIDDPDGYPRVVPLNFVLIGECIYFHGALQGEKFDQLKTDPKVSFCFVEPYSMIPSDWQTGEYACSATVFFKSVYLRGVGSVVVDPDEKAMALQALMEKHQPEGRYRAIRADDPLYDKALEDVAVFKIVPDRMTTRLKFGQNLSAEQRRRLIDKLRERGEDLDILTAAEIEKTL
ncbi:MAG TPA: pyridoxamine 5'-phosphate oxidase family protein [Acidobacteriota bacterium]|nr:pyridoxamine 5'-phosphate oxidase family protein [Acidobacteriota bacterium]